MIPVPGLFGYAASEDGSVYSVRRGCRGAAKKLSAHLDACGYQKVKAAGKVRFVHRLVATAYHGEVPPGMEVNHLDGVKTNNRPENLQYVTRAQNMQHAHDTGLLPTPRGEASPFAKLTDAKCRELRGEYHANVVNGRLPRGVRHEIAARYGISPQYVRLIGLGRTRRNYHDKGGEA